MEDFTTGQWEAILALAHRVAAAPDEAVLRRAVMERIGELIPHARSFFDLCSNYHGKRLYFDPVSLNIPPESMRDYYEGYEDLDYTSWLLNQTVESSVYRDSDYFTDKLRQHSQLYRDWLRPLGVYYSCGFNLIEGGVPYGSLTLFRSLDEGDFSDGEMRVLERLMPFIGLRFAQLYPNGITYNAHLPQFRELQASYLLTERENEIVRLMAVGTDTKEIAGLLYISQGTVRKHVANIYRKMRVNNRAQLMKLVAMFLDQSQNSQ